MALYRNISTREFYYQVTAADMNPNQTMHGGVIMTYMDDATGTCCHSWANQGKTDRQHGKKVFTAAFHDIRFLQSPLLDDLIRFTATIIDTGSSSMDAVVYGEIVPEQGPAILAAIGFVTYVAVHPDGSKAQVPPLAKSTETACQYARIAEQIRQQSKTLTTAIKALND